MNDLLKPLTTAPPITPIPGASPPSAVATAFAAIGSLPPAMADVTAGTVIAGIVVERGRGMVLLKTDKGMLQLQTNLALKLGTSVTLEVQSVGAQLRLAIIAVDQHAPPAPAREALGLATSQPQSSGARDTASKAGPNHEAATPLIGRTLMATIVGPPETQSAVPGSDPAIPTLLRRIMAISALVRAASDAPAAGAVPQDSSPRGSPNQAQPLPSGPPPGLSGIRTPPPSMPLNANPAFATSAGGPEPLPVIPSAADLETALQSLPAPAREIIAMLLDDAVVESETTADVPHRPTGSVIPTTGTPTTAASTPTEPALPTLAAAAHDGDPAPPNQIPIQKTIAIRILAQSPPLADPAAAPPRAHVATHSDTITLVGTIVADDATGIEIATPIGRLRLPVPAPVAVGGQVIFEVLARTADDLASPGFDRTADAFLRATVETTRDWSLVRELATAVPETADSILPKAGQPFAPALLAFIAAVRAGGNAKAWLGTRVTNAIDASDKTALIARLGEDLAAQGRSAATSDVDGWQTIAVPVIDAERISELRFRFHKRGQREDGRDETGRRFIVEATLSVLGPLQLDGIVRERHLDLIVRTAAVLPAPMRREIEELFARSLSDTNYRGDIRFRDEAGEARAHGTAGRGAGVVV